MLVTVVVTSIIVSCSGNPEVDRQLTVAENMMAEHPDSALSVLNGIDTELVTSEAEKARYALLMSQALDKNYIDTTTFDVLQPAIDYYIDKDKGTPDEKLRTYYYKGRIFQNNSDYDKAMLSFINASEVSSISDTLTLAHIFVAQGTLYFRQYKADDFVTKNLQAATLYSAIGKNESAIFSYCNALDGCSMLNDKNKADSILYICLNLINEYPDYRDVLADSYLTYNINFGEPEKIRTLLSDIQQYNIQDQLTIANAYLTIGDYKKALLCIDNTNIGNTKADTLHYLSIKTEALERCGQSAEALATYKKYNKTLEEYHYELFAQDLLFAEEHHKLELETLKEKNYKERIIWISIGIVLILCIVIFIYKSHLNKLRIKNANDLLRIQTLQSNLFESGQKQKDMAKKIEELFGSRFSLIDKLATSYFECKETGQEQKKIYAEVKKELNNFGSQSSIQELESIVNGYNDNLMRRFREDFPKFSSSQYKLALFLFCGFSFQSISLFTGADLRNVYVYKSRLKSAIAKSDVPRKAEYLRYFE